MSSIKPMISVLEELFTSFNTKFYNGEMEKPVITISPDTTKGCYGWTTSWKSWSDKEETNEENEDGFYEINICSEYMNRTPKQITATLLHEMVHIWHLQNGIKGTSRGSTYHNKKFKDTGESHGLIINHSEKNGWSVTELNEDAEKCVDYLNEKNAFEFGLHRTKMYKGDKAKKKSSSRKYACPDCGMTVRATKEVNVLCGDCNVTMESEE